MYEIGTVDFYDNNKRFFGKLIPNLAPDKRIKFNRPSLKNEEYVPLSGETVVFFTPNDNYATEVFQLSQTPFPELDINEDSFRKFLTDRIPDSLKAAAGLYGNFSEKQKALFLQVLSQNEIQCSDYFDATSGRSIYETLKNDSFLRVNPELRIDGSRICSGGAERYKNLKDAGIIKDYADSNIQSALELAAMYNALPQALNLLGIEERQWFHTLSMYEGLSESPLCMKYGKQLIDELFKQMDTAVFDLETKGEVITQAGLVPNSGKEFSVRNKSANLSEKELQSFCEQLEKHKTIAGHNIKEYDLRILENLGFKPENHAIWDTYEIQAALSPFSTDLRLYNPNDPHNALPDAKAAAGLMKAQIIELATLNTKPNHLPLDEGSRAKYEEILALFKENTALGRTMRAGNDSATYFRKHEETPMNNDIPKAENGQIIIASKRYWKGILKLNPGISFAGAEGFQVLDPGKIKDWKTDGLTAILKKSLLANGGGMINEAEIHPAAKAIAREKLKDLYAKPELSSPLCTDLQGFRKIPDNAKEAAIVILLYGQDTLEEECFYSSDPLDAASLPPEITNIGPWSHYKEIDEKQYEQIVGCRPDENHEGLWIERTLQHDHVTYYIRQAIPFEIVKAQMQQKYADKLCSNNSEIAENDLPVTALEIVEETTTSGDQGKETPILSPTARTRAAFWAQQAALIIKEFEFGKRRRTAIWVTQDDLLEKEDNAIKGIFKDRGIFYLDGKYDLRRKLEIAANRNDTTTIVSTTQENLIRLRPSDIPAGTDIIIGNTGYERDLLMLSKPGKETDMTRSQAAVRSSRRLSRIKAAFPSCNVFTTDPRAVLLTERGNLKRKRYDINGEWKIIYSGLKDVFDSLQKEHPLDKGEMTTEEAIEAMRKEKGEGFEWRKAQLEVLPHILSKKHNNLITMPTGSGKSILFQAPALFRSAVTHKLSLVISPLKALQKDQVASLSSRDVDFLNSDMTSGQKKLSYMRIRGGETLLLYMTPEAFRSRPLMNALHYRAANDGGLEYIIFDEAHCISQWGLDFRPDYRYAASKAVDIKKAYPGTAIELFTATMTEAVKNDIRSIVGFNEIVIQDATVLRHDIALYFQEEKPAGKLDNEKRAETILKDIKQRNFDSSKSSAIIFTRTRRQAEEIAQVLSHRLSQDKGMRHLSDAVSFFHGGMTAEERDDAYYKFRGEEGYEKEYRILVATKAFGMGMDIPDIHYVYHAFPPDSIEDYLQEIGRAGRDRNKIPENLMPEGKPELPATCLYSGEDHLKVADLQDKESLSWNDIENIAETIRKYARSAIKDPADYISVPYNLWENDDRDRTPADNEADFKNGLHWLEQAGIIETSYRTSMYIDIERLKAENEEPTAENTVKEFADRLRKERAGSTFQLDITATAKRHGKHWNDILKTLLEMEEAGEIRVTSETPFQMSAKYKREKNEITETEFSERTEKIFAAAKDAISAISLEETPEENIKNNICNKDPQASEEPKARNEAASRARIVVRLLAHTDTVRSGFKDGKRTMRTVNPESARIDLEKAKEQALCLLNYLATIYYGTSNDERYTGRQAFIWTTAARECGFASYAVINKSLEMLQILGYVSAGRLLQGGIKVKLKNTDIAVSYKKTKADFKEAADMKRLRLISMAVLPKIKEDKRETALEEYFRQSNAVHLASWLSSLPEKQYLIDNTRTDRQKDTVITMLEQYQGEAYSKQYNLLDKEQKAAVSLDKDKDAIIFAGPGSGKTRVLTMRCAYLIRECQIREKKLLVLAYNRQTTEELRKRLKVLFMNLGYSEKRTAGIQTHTFHSFIKKIADIASAGEGQKVIGDDIDKWENEFSEYLDEEKNRVQLANVLRRENYSAEFILVDEFQDITEDRLNILEKMGETLTVANAGKKPKFFVIGDNNQSIYGYQRRQSFSAIPLIEEFEQYLSGGLAKTAPLRRNYRSSQTILNYAEQIVGVKEKTLKAVNKEVSALKDNVKEIAIDNLLTAKEYEGAVETTLSKGIHEMAFLFRTNQEMVRFYSQIINKDGFNKKNGIHFVIHTDSEEKFFRTRECYQIIHELQTRNKEKITEKDIEKTLKKSNERAKHGILDPEAIELTNSVFLAAVDRSEDQTGSDIAKIMEEIASEPMSKLLKLIPLFRESSSKEETKDGMKIALMTVHKAKGLEFDSVVVAPSTSPIQEGQSLEDTRSEERRILFVASTRAKRYLRVYRNRRTDAFLKNKPYNQGTEEVYSGLDASSKLSNYYLNFVSDEETMFRIKKGDSVEIKDKQGGLFIYWKDKCIGQFSRTAAKGIKTGYQQSFHINDIYVWRKADAERSDETNKTTYAKSWKSHKDYIWITTII